MGKAKVNIKFSLSRRPALRQFYERIIAPTFKHLTIRDDETEWARAKLAIWFDAANRDIVAYRCKYKFKIVGAAWETPSTPLKFHVNGAGERHVEPGDLVWVRFDARKPDQVEIEFKDQVFVASVLFFDTVMRSKLEEMNDVEALAIGGS